MELLIIFNTVFVVLFFGLGMSIGVMIGLHRTERCLKGWEEALDGWRETTDNLKMAME
jgi:hypothetical protein